MTKHAIYPQVNYKCPNCKNEWRMLKGDTAESVVKCMACNTRFKIGAHLTKRAPDARKSAPKSRSKTSKGSAKPARG